MDKLKAMEWAGELAFTERPTLKGRIKSAQRQRHFEELARSWDLWHSLYFDRSPSSVGARKYRTLLNVEADRIGAWLGPKATVLDLGCGTGKILKLVARRCRRAHGLDISPKAIEHAARNCLRLRNVELHLAEGWRLPFREDRFDLVFCLGMLQYVDLELAISYLQEVSRILKPGGRFLFELPNLLHGANVDYLLRPNDTNWPGPHRLRFWSVEMVQTFLSRTGFRLEELTQGRSLQVRAAKKAKRPSNNS